jgi:hypothetical protein
LRQNPPCEPGQAAGLPAGGDRIGGTPDGLPLAYEILPGNTADCTTLRMFLARIERQYGRARRVWVMDRGIPTGAVLAEMRECDPPVQYLVGTPKGRLSRLQKQLPAKPRQEALEPLCRAMQSAAARQSESVRLPRLEYIGTAGTPGCHTARPCCTGRR